jgi:hypothetical protein
MDAAELQQRRQADARWLSGLTAAINDRRYAALQSALIERVGQSEEISQLGLDRELLAAWGGFGEDSLLTSLFNMAISELDLSIAPGADLPEDLFFIQAAVPTVNGFAVRTPNLGAAAVVVNNGLPTYISGATHITLALTNFTDQPYCPHHEPEEFLDALLLEADGILSCTPYLLLRIPVDDCFEDHERDEGGPDSLHHYFCLLAELFILYHELGHICLGHLHGTDVSRLNEESSGETLVFNRSMRNELAADQFAYDQLVRWSARTDPAIARDVVYAAGCFLVLVHAVELVAGPSLTDTHPPAADRWKAIRARIEPLPQNTIVHSVDHLLDWLTTNWAGLAPSDADAADSRRESPPA